MSIGKKLYTGFGILILFLLISSTVGYTQLKKIDDDYTFILEDSVQKINQARNISDAISAQGVYVRSYILEPSEATIENLKKQQAIIDTITVDLEKIFVNTEMLNQLQKIKDSQQMFNATSEEILSVVKAGQTDEAVKLLSSKARPANEGLRSAVLAIIDFQTTEMETIKTEAQESARLSTIFILIIAIFSTILAFAVAVFITRAITVPVNKLSAAAAVIANGDLSQEDVTVKTKDEIRDLSASFNLMKSNLHALINNIATNVEQTTAAAEQLSASTDEVALSSNDVAKRVEIMAEGAAQSAATGKESSVAMEETANGVQRIAEATQMLHSKAVDTQAVANEGEKTLITAEEQMLVIQKSSHETNERIKKLSAQSAEIENISKVITAITEQTNLLALNAAIEAARAGEHGKGFAVVADEVRKLAEESKNSANQIVGLTTLIQQDTKEVENAVSTTVNNVEEGVTFIQNAQTAFGSIMGAIQDMASQIEEVSASSEEISASTEQVAASVNEMSSASENSSEQSEMIAAAVEEQTATMQEISAVARSLSTGAMDIQEQINQFKI
ncbi:methyl-accepting chemotaxis protein [Psychrobacillus sp.]|uniref:methyl-accepting chemotaxis protein n=1 Tax=Psychrobacillus sp. TaxID=1871623 RepID=UPI0028BED88E|nr:methyl-accepting chemotaxis protein [Psychrobacillus sp.]